MVDPTITGAGIGGVIVATFWGITKLVPVIANALKPNSGSNDKLKSAIEHKPGKAQICIDRGTILTQHSETIKRLVDETKDSRTDRKEIKIEIKQGFQRIYDKLDGK